MLLLISASSYQLSLSGRHRVTTLIFLTPDEERLLIDDDGVFSFAHEKLLSRKTIEYIRCAGSWNPLERVRIPGLLAAINTLQAQKLRNENKQLRKKDLERADRIRREDLERADRIRREDLERADKIRKEDLERADRVRRVDLEIADRVRAENRMRGL